MESQEQRIAELSKKIGLLSQQHSEFAHELNDLKHELRLLLSEVRGEKPESVVYETANVQMPSEPISDAPDIPVAPPIAEPEPKSAPGEILMPGVIRMKPQKQQATKKPPVNLEKFIGENLINKIGILILVIGVGIGAKYSIEHDLISPLTRIILGYLVGLVVLGLGIKLKAKYESYSAVLVSGAISIMYFITFAAYSFYVLMPQTVAFLLMVLFTVFTVVAAIHYNKQVIAHIGLVGAYAVPFLLSDGSGRIDIMFTYMAIINAGILAISFKKYWKPLYYTSFGFTWLVYISWYADKYQTDVHFMLALIFATIFFVIFYATFLAYKLTENNVKLNVHPGLLLANSFLYYAVGYSILDNHPTGKYLLGAFTVCNAILHFVVAIVVLKRRLETKELFYFVSGMVLTFLTLAVPVQLDGNWVTIVWACEAALLFWIGRTRNVPMYEIMSYPLAVLAFGSYMQDVDLYYLYDVSHPETRIQPILNVLFLTSVLVSVSFGFMVYIRSKFTVEPEGKWHKMLLPVFSILLPIGAVLTAYFTFQNEISCYCIQLYQSSMISQQYIHDYDYLSYDKLWVLIYTMMFVAVPVIVFRNKVQKELPVILITLLSLVLLFAFITLGFYEAGELRDSYIYQTNATYYHHGIFNIVIRYITIACAGILVFAWYRITTLEFLQGKFSRLFDIVVSATAWILVSNELIQWMDFIHTEHPYKLGLSILWGAFALVLIFIGIRLQKKHVRIFAIGLLAFTIAKLFLFDITSMDTITKTVLFISLGVLLLASSFLYNKFKSIIFDETT